MGISDTDPSDRYKVLVIDDEEDLRAVLCQRLSSCGLEVIEAGHGLKGIDLALKEQPDLVILDLMMPGMTGYEVWQEFQRHPDLMSIPILILTCKRQSQDHFWGESMSPQDFFSKPYDTNKLIKRIARVLHEQEEEYDDAFDKGQENQF